MHTRERKIPHRRPVQDRGGDVADHVSRAQRRAEVTREHAVPAGVVERVVVAPPQMDAVRDRNQFTVSKVARDLESGHSGRE